jgi:hypothetical protein
VPTNLLILPLLAGFWFINFCHYFRFRAQRLDGYRLLIESSLAGALLFLVGRTLTFLVGFTPAAPVLSSWWTSFAPISFSGTATLAFAIGIAAPFAVNRFWKEDDSKQLAVMRHGNAMLVLFDQAIRQSRAVAVTLDNRKVYIGYVITAPNLRPDDAYVGILPVISGYREEGTLALKYVSTYDQVYAEPEIDPNQFKVTVPIAAIKMACFFDPALYPKFAENQE